jgi:hypothetical protein
MDIVWKKIPPKNIRKKDIGLGLNKCYFGLNVASAPPNLRNFFLNILVQCTKKRSKRRDIIFFRFSALKVFLIVCPLKIPPPPPPYLRGLRKTYLRYSKIHSLLSQHLETVYNFAVYHKKAA